MSGNEVKSGEKEEFDMSGVQTGTDQIKKVAANNPFLVGGIGLGLGGLFYMARNFKNKGEVKTSVYLIHTRMVAQMSVIGMLTLGMMHQIYTKLQEENVKIQSQMQEAKRSKPGINSAGLGIRKP